jgi:hypothetical protein
MNEAGSIGTELQISFMNEAGSIGTELQQETIRPYQNLFHACQLNFI